MSQVQLPADGVGKKINTAIVTDTGESVHRQIIVIGSPTTAKVAEITDLMPTTGEVPYVPMRPLPQKRSRTTFSKSLASGVDTTFWQLLCTGSGMAISQSNSNLVVTTGTTANAETILRSLDTVGDPFTFRYAAQLSQRIANQNFIFELVDVIGDGLAVTINSATSITVAIPGNPFTVDNIGQSVIIGNLTGMAGAIPGRYAISAVSGNNVTFTVAGWPASGSGTASLFGWNYHQIVYNGTTATNNTYDAAKNGWASGATTCTINTTATGHVGIINSEDGVAAYLDQVVASSVLLQTSTRASRNQNLPGPTTPLYLQIRILNGSSAPASTTTLTAGFVSMENYQSQQVSITSARAQSYNAAMPVALVAGANGQANQVTVQGISRGSSNNGGNPLFIATGVSANPTQITTGRNVDLMATLIGQLVNKPYSVPEVDWTYASAAGGITNTTAVAIKAAAGAGIRNYLTGCSIQNASGTVSTEVTLLDGATVIWRGFVGSNLLLNSIVGLNLLTPLRTTANTALNAQCGTTGAAVYVNAQGYSAP